MALRVHNAERRARPLRVVPPPASVREGAEEFAYPSHFVSVPVLGMRRLLVRLVLAVLVIVAAIFVVQRLTATRQTTVHLSRPATASRSSVDPSRATVAAAGLPTGVPMSVLRSTLHPDTTAHTYRASVTLRNPTDLAAAGVRVDATFKDASGNVILTVTRSLDTLASGQVTSVDLSGELGTQAPVPATLDLTAVAAQLVS